MPTAAELPEKVRTKIEKSQTGQGMARIRVCELFKDESTDKEGYGSENTAEATVMRSWHASDDCAARKNSKKKNRINQRGQRIARRRVCELCEVLANRESAITSRRDVRRIGSEAMACRRRPGCQNKIEKKTREQGAAPRCV